MLNRSPQERFKRVVEARKKAMKQDPLTHEEQIEERQKQRNAWVNPGRSSGVSNAGVSLDAATIAARDAEKARRAAAKNPVTPQAPPPISDRDELAIARAWVNANPAWFGSPFNISVMGAILKAYNLPKTFAGFDAAFKFGVEHNHFEPARRHRGQPAPRPFFPPERETADDQQPTVPPTQTGIPTDDYRELQSMSLGELQAKARAGMSAYNPAKRGE